MPERPSHNRLDDLRRRLSQYKGIDPRLTFNWPLSKSRRDALEIVESKNPDPEKIVTLLRHPDFVEKRAALEAMKRVNMSSRADEILPELELIARNKDPEWKELAAQAFGNVGITAFPYLEELAGDPNERVYRAAAKSLARFGTKGISHIENMSYDGNSQRRSTAACAFGEIGPKALYNLAHMVDDPDPLVRSIVAQSLGKMGAKAIRYVRLLSKDPEPLVRRYAARSYGSMGTTAIPFIKDMIRDPEWSVHITAARSLGMMGPGALPYLKRMAKKEDNITRTAVVEAYGRMGNTGFRYLRDMMDGNEPVVRRSIAYSLGRMGPNALPYLRDMAEDPDPSVRQEVASSLGKMGKKALPDLKRLSKDPDESVVAAVNDALNVQGGFRELLGTKKPLFATAHRKALVGRVRRLQEISDQMRKEFGEDFTGITVFGSTAKGFMSPNSDLDYAVIARNPRAAARFKELAGDLPLCETMSERTPDPEELRRRLFHGIFFGDHDRLKELQREAIFDMDSEEWERIRNQIKEGEGDLSKARNRFGLKEHKIRTLRVKAIIRKVPPPLDEMRKRLQVKKAA